jgi:hypothetical protein
LEQSQAIRQYLAEVAETDRKIEKLQKRRAVLMELVEEHGGLAAPHASGFSSNPRFESNSKTAALAGAIEIILAKFPEGLTSEKLRKQLVTEKYKGARPDSKWGLFFWARKKLLDSGRVILSDGQLKLAPNVVPAKLPAYLTAGHRRSKSGTKVWARMRTILADTGRPMLIDDIIGEAERRWKKKWPKSTVIYAIRRRKDVLERLAPNLIGLVEWPETLKQQYRASPRAVGTEAIGDRKIELPFGP